MSRTFAALRASLESRQMTLLRGFLELAQDGEDVQTLCAAEQPFIHLSIGDLGDHGGFTGSLYAGESWRSTNPCVRGQRYAVAVEQAGQGLNVPPFSVTDVDEGPNLAKVGNHLIIGGPRLVFIIQRLVERENFGIRQ